MTEKEYSSAKSEIVREYFREEGRIIAEKKRARTFGRDPDKDFGLFLQLNLKMRRRLENLEKQYAAQPIHAPAFGRSEAMS